MRFYGLSLWVMALVAFPLAGIAETQGWEGMIPSRPQMRPGKVYWQADLGKGLDGFIVKRVDGAEGTVSIDEVDGAKALRIVKTNSSGYIVVEPKERFDVPAGTELQAYAYVSGTNCDPEYSFGFLRMYGKKRSYAYCKDLDGRGPGGPMMDNLFNTVSGATYRKLCRFPATEANGTSVMPSIVVAGMSSESVWRDWGVEDLKVSKKNWAKFLKKVTPPDHSGDRQEEAAFDASIARDCEHVAKVIRRDGRSFLCVDGRETMPVVYKGKSARGADGASHYCGKKMEESGVRLQVVSTRFGDSPKSRGFWTPNGYDAKSAVADIKDAMRMAPNSLFILTLILDAYPEFTDEHPDEVWTLADGRAVWGHNVHAGFTFDPEKAKKSGQWRWASNHSLVWRDAVKRNIATLVEELRRQGLSKRIVGIHLGGYHDAQFATRHPDFSKPAVAVFRRWQESHYGKVRWFDAPVFGDEPYLRPGRDDAQIAYYRFLKVAPFEMLEDLAGWTKRCFSKDIVAVRWCMSAFGGTFCSAYDITAFANSRNIDIIVPQPDYKHRIPGIGIGQRLPSESFHLHGKLFINEFDLRTYGAVSGGESELRVTGLSQSVDDAMWQSTYRKLAGMMLADGHGWWFYDMAGGWFEPDGIAADIRDSIGVIRALQAKPVSKWSRSAAIVIDEEGAMLRNTVHKGRYYNFDEENLFSTQMQILSSSGVPYDILLAADLMKDPSIGDKYRTIVFMGMYSIDAARKTMLDRLKSKGRTLVFLSGTGVCGGADETGFSIDFGMTPASNEVVAEPGVDVNMASYANHALKPRLLGVQAGGYWTPRRDSVSDGAGVSILARYASDRKGAVAERGLANWKGVFIGSAAGLTPQYFNRLVAESGGYAPMPYGVQVNMNGNFVSLHCTIPGRYDFKLPFPCTVRNLKTREIVSTSNGCVRMDLVAGGTYWFRLHRL